MNSIILHTLETALNAFDRYCGGRATYDETCATLTGCVADLVTVERRTRDKDERQAIQAAERLFFFRLFEIFNGGVRRYGTERCVLTRAAAAIDETQAGLRRRFPELAENKSLTRSLRLLLN